MILARQGSRSAFAFLLFGVAIAVGCNSGNGTTTAPAQPPFMSVVAQTPPAVAAGDEAPAAEKTGRFDGQRAYEQVVKQVSFGPRSPGTPAIAKLQEYLEAELESYGCAVETDSFSADTPVGRVPMKNILVKIPGEKPGIIMLGTHYDTKRMDNFVGADDAGSSTGVTLELARLLCKRQGKYAVWIAFFDAEEAFNAQWVDPDHTYGSREMTARLAASGDLSKVRAFILTDLVGGKNPHFLRDGESTKWLRDLVWNVAARLGYGQIFGTALTTFGGDDHYSFTVRKVPSVDIMDLDTSHDVPYWHTPQDTIDKISPKTLAIVGHVVLESVNELQKK
jgi:glutaminyl-peptide cyclotransferase